MLDFVFVSARSTKNGHVEIYPKFVIKKSSDLMVRGGDFYAIWVEERGLWSTDEQDAINLIDHELDIFTKEFKKTTEANVRVLHMWDAESGTIDAWHKYCQRQMRDGFQMLDERIIFSNHQTSKKDYASKKLNYPLEQGDFSSYDKLMSVLYSEDERRKIEWAIGSIVEGDSKKIQKFIVLYGSAGTGKSTVLNIIQKLFDGYFSVFDAKSLGSSNDAFALEAFRSNPLVALQHDGDLSKIEDNTRLNSLVSHETMTVNEKFKSAYANRFKCFLFMGTNKPVKITDAKSGLIRRLIDVSPSGKTLPQKEYEKCINRIDFELGAIAWHCREVYLSCPNYYDDYIPVAMLGASNDFYNFVADAYFVFKKDDGVTLKAAWEMYKNYCEDARVAFPYPQRKFKEELKNYFRDFKERFIFDDGNRTRSYYDGFLSEKFNEISEEKDVDKRETSGIIFESETSPFEEIYRDAPAQYATKNDTPSKKWIDVTTTLSDLDTSKTHYVKPPENHIVIDFDISENGVKSLEKNVLAASKFPATYAEISKSGNGVHLHYIYTGDVSKLSRVYGDHIEIKTFTGNSSLRRKFTKSNGFDISEISSGLPLKGEKMINFETVKSEQNIRNLIKKNLKKDIHAGTKPSVDFIVKILYDAYNSGISYDVSDMRNDILIFAANSTNQSDYCIKLVGKMKFKSEEKDAKKVDANSEIVFFDIEVFPNLFLVCYKIAGEGKPVIRMINPTPAQIEELMRFRLVGFNCRRYDNHILYAGLLGYTNEQIYNVSQRIISGSANCFFGEAYNISYTDVYDFSSVKQSLKHFEIELGIHHAELGFPWDKPVPEELWVKVADYCDNDVLATEATFNARKSDFLARQILADLAGMSVNDTTNNLTTRIIFGGNKNPQSKFNYRFMGSEGSPIFSGYTFDGGKSTYRGEEVGEGGYVYSEPGMYTDVALLDIASMHPTSIVAENLFGDEYTARFKDILDARMAIKHKDFEKARTMLGGALARYLDDENAAKDLSQALKIAINSVYGLTKARFDNPFRDIRNKDNIVAKRGALFMINLKHEVQARGFTVAHIKTDSIKIPNATPDIIKFVTDYGKQYGYDFEHEATYEKLCLVNDAVYIAKERSGEWDIDNKEEKNALWKATGTQFAVPYVFKKIFSKEDVMFDDMCETKAVQTALYLDMNEKMTDGEHAYHFVGKVGRFCPVKSGCGGGILLREKVDKKTGEKRFSAATGSKNFRWIESEMVKALGKENDIERSYYDIKVDEAIKSLSQYGDVEWFIGD